MKELLNLEKDFQRGRWLLIAAFGFSLIVALTAVILAFRYSNEFSKRIYLLNRGEAIQVTSGKVTDNRPAEVRHHVGRFHELFFTVSPDPKSIDENLRRAMFLCDESARKLYNNLSEQNFYREMVQGNVTQRVRVDSVVADLRHYPYRAVTYAQLVQERASATVTRSLVTETVLVDVNRSDNTPNGLLMRDFHILSSRVTREYTK
jgi:conjugative transposon TraK protein